MPITRNHPFNTATAMLLFHTSPSAWAANIGFSSSAVIQWVNSRLDPFVAALSTDGAKTWPGSKLLEGDLKTEFHYPAIHFVGDAVLVTYSYNTTGGPHRGSLRVRRLTLDWLRR